MKRPSAGALFCGVAMLCPLMIPGCSPDSDDDPEPEPDPDPVVISDIDYVKRKIYRLADPELLAGGTAGLPVRNFELFLDDRNPLNDLAEGAVETFAFMNATAGSQTDSTGVYRGFFHRLNVNEDYQVIVATGE